MATAWQRSIVFSLIEFWWWRCQLLYTTTNVSVLVLVSITDNWADGFDELAPFSSPDKILGCMLIFLQNCCFHSCDSRPFHHYEQRHQPKACWTKYFFTVTCMKLFTRASTSFPCVCSFEWNAGKVYKVVHGQGCALAEPCGPWHPTFALGQQENLFFFFQTNHMLGNLDFTGLEHWAPFNFLRELPWWIFFRLCTWDAW